MVLAKAGEVLREHHGDLLVSRYRLKQAEGIALIRANWDEVRQSLAFTSRPFILCGLPVRRPPKDQLLFERFAPGSGVCKRGIEQYGGG